jgi:hypothetical protein
VRVVRRADNWEAPHADLSALTVYAGLDEPNFARQGQMPRIAPGTGVLLARGSSSLPRRRWADASELLRRLRLGAADHQPA